MQRLPWLDRLLLLGIVSIWLIALALHVRQAWKGELAHVAFYVTAGEGPASYPTISGFWPGEAASAERFAIGDRILALNGVDLVGVGPYDFFARALAQLAQVRRREPTGTVTVRYLHGDEPKSNALPLAPAQFPWRMLPLTTTFVVTGVLVLLRRPATRLARAFFLGATLYSLHWTWFFGGSARVTYAWYVVYFFTSGLMLPFMLRAASLFPEEVAPKGRMPRWPWLFLVGAPFILTGSVGAPLPPRLGLPGIWLLNVSFIVALLAVLTRNYVRSGEAGRRQLRWGVFGMYVGLVPLLIASGVLLVVPSWWWLLDVTACAEVVIPISILIAIVRSNLYDIDRLITSAIAYTILSVLLLGGVLIVAPRVADFASHLIGLDPSIGVPVFSGILAVTLVVCQRFLSPIVERLLFRERYSLDRGIQGLLADLQTAPDARSLLQVLGDRLDKLFRPEHATVYVRQGEEFVATFVAGSPATKPERVRAIRAGDPLIVLATAAPGPFDVDDWLRRRRVRSSTHADRVALETACAAVVFTIGEEDPSAFVALGSKRSGDVYAPGDIALLTAVADAASTNMTRVERARRTASGPVLLPRKYEMLGEIGRGGMGAVYRVRHASLDQVRAMKILPEHLANDEMLLARFRREARVMAELRHPHIVRVFDFDQEGTLYYFVMECIDGASLSQRLRKHGALPFDEVVRVAWEVAQGLMFAHGHQPAVVHRDIKPANILIERETGRAVVTDFGIAKILEPQESLRTRTGDVFGTLKYCAPEQLRGESDVDGRVDIYSLGMVLYEMVTGRQFFAGMDEAQVLAAALQDEREYPLPDDFSPELHPIVARAIAKDRTRRYQDITEVLAGLYHLVPEKDRNGVARSPGTSPIPRRADSVSDAPTLAPAMVAATQAATARYEPPIARAPTDTALSVTTWERPWRLLGGIAAGSVGLFTVLLLGWYVMARARGW